MMLRQPVVMIVSAVVVIGVLAAGIVYVANLRTDESNDAFGRNEIASNGNVQGDIYPGDPTSEAQLVEREEQRLVYVRTIASAARWRVTGLKGPYRLRTGSTYTLVLPGREKPYTVADLLKLAPKAFVRQKDGSYLLSESIVVLPGANFSLIAPKGAEGLDIRLLSGPESFVSIVALGGSLTVAGSEAADVTVTSWNNDGDAADRRTDDGRAYIRLLGGHASLEHAHISNLGFWSGNTGGLSLTGTDTAGTFGDEPPPPAQAEAAAEEGARLLPEDQLTALAAETGEDYSIVTAGIKNVTIENNAFGLFLTNARDVAIEDTAISGSLVDGLVLHRFVTDAAITRTSSTDNFVDGFAIGRSTTSVVLKDSISRGNGRNGISLDGRPLADGPNAVGTAVKIYGGNRIIQSTFEDNKRYGIEISGGRNLEVRGNTIVKNKVGVVVSHGAERVDIFANNLRNQVEQAIALREAGASTAVRHNDIRGGNTGIYVRNSGAAVSGNTLNSISNHGITLRGDVRGTNVASNVISGFGSSAVWDEESRGAALGENDLLGWRPAYTFERAVNFVFQPLTFVWLLLGGLLLVTAMSGRRARQEKTIRSPYAERVPLTSLSKGIVSPDDVGQRQ